jgi:hypothetical protein
MVYIQAKVLTTERNESKSVEENKKYNKRDFHGDRF